MTDNPREEINHWVHFTAILYWLSNLENRQRLRYIDKQSRVGKQSARADTSSKPERQIMRIRLGDMIFSLEEPLGFENLWIMVDIRIVSEKPSY